jgi:PAS domain S-box-containing protein
LSLPPEVRSADPLAGPASISEAIASGGARTAGDALFLRLFELVPVGVALLDAEGRVLRVNRAFGELFGYPGEWLVGRDLAAVIVPDFLRHETVLRGEPGPDGGPSDLETVRRRADGALVEVSARTSRIEAGGVTLAHLVVYQQRADRGRRVAEQPEWLVAPPPHRPAPAPPPSPEHPQGRRIMAAVRSALEVDGSADVRLARLARALVPELGDSCILYLVDDAQRVRRAEVVFADPGQEQLMLEQLINYPPDLDRLIPPVARALRSGESQLLPDVSLSALKATPGDRDHVSVALLVGLTSLLVVPLVQGGRVYGALSLATAASGRRYLPADMALVEEVARYASRVLAPLLA